MIDVLLMIPTLTFESSPVLIETLINIVLLCETDRIKNEENKLIIQRSISLIYTLTMSHNICEMIASISLQVYH